MPAGGEEGMMAQLTPVVKWLLFLNIGIYLVDAFIFGERIRNFGAFAIGSAMYEGRLWQFVTFQFIHGSVPHILMNSIGLFFFGPWMERWWGSMQFLLFYLISGIGGALFFTILVFFGMLPQDGIYTPLIGASAGLYGILVGVAVIAPSLQVALLFPPITLTMRQLALALMAISVGSILLQFGGNEGGEAGHLGGAIVGFFLIQSAVWSGRERSSTRGLGGAFSPKRGPRQDIEPKIRPRTRVDLRGQSHIDEILDKISQHGFQSLTDDERDLLHQAAKNEKDRP